ncbi:MAG: outer membrane protein transport protein [Planctomycetota bacterium]
MRRFHVLVLAAALSVAGVSLASGFKVNEQGAKGGAMGLAFVGQADNATTVALNLAGIHQLTGTNVAFTWADIYVPGREFESNVPTAVIDGQEADSQLFTVPSTYITSDLGTTRWHVGLAIYNMFGLTQDWNDTGVTFGGAAPPAGGFSRSADRVSLKTTFINPVVAYEVIEDKLSFAAGFIAGYGDLKADATPVVNLIPFTLGVRELAQIEQDVDGWGFSFNVGVHAKLSDTVRAGAYYRHSLALDMDGEFDAERLNTVVFGAAGSFETDEDLELTLPGTVGFGVAWQATPEFLVEVDGEYNTWEVFDTVDVDLENSLNSGAGAPVITSATLTQHPEWESSWAARVGGQYSVSKCVDLRLGYFFDETPVPDDTLEATIPDADRHGITTGAGFRCGSWIFDFAYMAVFTGDRDVNNTYSGPQNPVVDGEFSSDPVHVFMLTVGTGF